VEKLWSSFPRWWVGERLRNFHGGKTAGASMSALRVYLGIALVSDYSTRIGTPSWDDLETLTGLSRPMVRNGLHAAEAAGLIAIDSSGYRHSYRLSEVPTSKDFVKVPTALLRQALPKMPTRGAHALDCLKIYIVLLRLLPRRSFHVAIGHKKLVEWTGVKANRLRAGIDVLINHRLVHVVKAEAWDLGHPHNEYHLLGFGPRVADTHDAIDALAATAQSLVP
jgi:hypothetical protein